MRVDLYSSEIDSSIKLLAKMKISALLSFAGVTTPSAFNALNFLFLSIHFKKTIHFSTSIGIKKFVGLTGFMMLILLASCDKEVVIGSMQLTKALANEVDIMGGNAIVPEGTSVFVFGFDKAVDETSFNGLTIKQISSASPVTWTYVKNSTSQEFTVVTDNPLAYGETYAVSLPSTIISESGDTLSAKTFNIMVSNDPLMLDSVRLNGRLISETQRQEGTGKVISIEAYFSHDIPDQILSANISLSRAGNNVPLVITKSAPGHYVIKPVNELQGFREYRLRFLEGLGAGIGKSFMAKEYLIFTNFPQLTDDELMDLVQRQTFGYFWEFGHPVSGLARERNTSGDVVTTGGSGFGLMAMIVAAERGYITRVQALERWEIMISFLRNADRFHGVWAHWMNGASGKVFPFSQRDDGGDLVETSFMVQALYTLRQYLNPQVAREQNLINRINILIDAVEWDWYTRGGQKVLYWHWSPNFGWAINLPMRGHNETLIAYVLAASSKTHPIDIETYKQGYARNGAMRNGNTYYGFRLPLGGGRGGPLFFTHYSFLGLDPRKLKDTYADYWEQNVNQTMINRAYCISNPLKYAGYGEKNWGLTASDGNNGYNAFSPDNDRGVIAPTGALSSMPYTPEESMVALRNYYYTKGDRLWGSYGFYDAFNDAAGWVADSYLAIDQGPIICMIENHRSGLLWNLFMSAPEIKAGLTKLGFLYE